MREESRIGDVAKAFKLLSSMPILLDVKKETISLMSSELDIIDLYRSNIVFDRDSEPTGLFFVLRGSVKLVARGSDQRSRVVELFRPGHMFGEIGVFTGKRYRTWTETAEDTSLLHVEKASVHAAVASDHHFTQLMLHYVTARIQRLIDAIGAVSSPRAEVRIAAYLLELAGHTTGNELQLTLPAAKCTIASLLNMSSESFSRALHRMRNADLLWVTGRKIRIRDKHKLIALTDAADEPAGWSAPKP